MDDGPTHYDILQVAENASREELEQARDRLKRQFDPIFNKDWHAAIDDAWDPISTDAKRKEYDAELAEKRAKPPDKRARAEAKRRREVEQQPPPPPPSPSPQAPARQTRTPFVPPEAFYLPPARYDSTYRKAEADTEGMIGSGVGVMLWLFFFTEGFAGFKVWWNPVAWIPFIWWLIYYFTLTEE